MEMLKEVASNNVKKRYAFIDILEALGILFVVMLHVRVDDCQWLDAGNYLHLFRYCFRSILAVCVPLFFFCNGFLLLNKTLDLRNHIIKILKLMVLTIVWGGVSVIIYRVKTKNFVSITQAGKYILNYNLAEWTSHLWYMGALVCLYLFFPVIKFVYDNKRGYFYYFGIMIFIFTFINKMLAYSLSLFLDVFMGKKVVVNTNLFASFNPVKGIYAYVFIYFFIGGLAFSFRDKIERIDKNKRNIMAILVLTISSACFSLMGICFSKIINTNWDFAWDGYETIFVIINTMAFFVLSLSFTKDIRIIQEISKNTLGIYFMQYIVIQLTRDFVKQFDFICTLSGNFLYSLIIVLFCTLISYSLRKIPILCNLVKL